MNEKQVNWSDKSGSIYESFAVGLQEFWKDGRKPRYGSKLIANGLEKQRDYMLRNNLSMTYDIEPNGLFANMAVHKGWSDQIFDNHMECRTCSLTRRIFKNGTQIYKDKEDVNLYITITSVKDRDMVLQEAYNCPNCGALSTVMQLENKCPYCETRFHISELYPKVINYFTVKSYGGTKQELKRRIWRNQFPVMILSIGYFIYHFNFVDVQSDIVLLNCLSAVLGGGVFGLIAGYIIFAFRTIAGLSRDAYKSIPMLVAVTGSQKRFMSIMQRYSPEFSYEFFSDKVVSILKQILSEERVEDNPYYVGPPTNIRPADIIEYSFKGAVALKSCNVEQEYCIAVVDVYMKNYYYDGKRIKKKDDIFRMTLRKNLTKTMNYHFSLFAIHCKSCGASFDAAKVKNCPNCQTRYEIGDDDWIVLNIMKH